MANRFMQQFQYSFEKRVVHVFAKVAFGSSGAPTLSTANSKGVVSITRNGAGDYTIVFGTSSTKLDPYYKLLVTKQIFYTGSGTAPASPTMHIRTDSTATAASCSIRVVFSTGGTATDPASGETVYLQFVFGDSSAY